MRYSLLVGVFALATMAGSAAEPLAGTRPLTDDGDLAAKMVAGIDKYLMRETAASVEKRKQYWKLDASSLEAYAKSVQPNRDRLKRILGVVDTRVAPTNLEYVAGRERTEIADAGTYRVFAVRWPVLEGVNAEGLLLLPHVTPQAWVVALPDADWTPEMFAGLTPGLPHDAQFARELAERGCLVLIPTLIDRRSIYSGNPSVHRQTSQPHREFIYRMAYEMGRHIIAYEIQKVLAAVDYFHKVKRHPPIAVVGQGEGGLIALYSGAIDWRIDQVVVSGYFGPRESLWQEPIYRNLFGVLREFGDAEVGLLYGPKQSLNVESCTASELHQSRNKANVTPGRLPVFSVEAVKSEWDRIGRLGGMASRTFITPPTNSDAAFDRFAPRKKLKKNPSSQATAGLIRTDAEARQKRQFDQLVNYTQKLMRDSEQRRKESFWSKIDTSSLDKFQASTKHFRDQFWEEVIGKLPAPTEPMKPRSRLSYDEPKWKGYEVTLDLYPDVFAYGILLVPKDLKPGERRPVVVCQHGLEGRPQDVVNTKMESRFYHAFGAKLADRGYIVFAPQNPYIGHDKFRVLQRKANPLGLSLFSFIVRQHERILDWLATQPFVDPERIAFYGLSYGGKTAMRVPAILPRYCLSICSGDFNEWIWKNVSVDFPASYMFSGEYEMPEFNLGHTFNYAEMAALIAPRPFMVERGHKDGVGIDEWVAYEYAKVRRLYDQLGIGDGTAIEYFNGPHEIHGVGTFAFLDKHLHWKPR